MKSATRMYVVKPSVGLMICSGLPRWAGSSSQRMTSFAKVKPITVVMRTASEATITRFRSSPRCCMRESSLSRSCALWLTSQG